jgi:DNA-binding PadR family transcriptional regulator
LSRPELSLFSYEILGLVGRQGVGAHDLLQMARRGRILDWAGESQYYVEPKRLAKLGYLEARKEPGKTRERTVYSLTDKGLEALGEDVTRETVGTLREDIADLRVRLDETEAAAHELPHREKYLLIANRHLRRLLDLHEQYIDEVERELR